MWLRERDGGGKRRFGCPDGDRLVCVPLAARQKKGTDLPPSGIPQRKIRCEVPQTSAVARRQRSRPPQIFPRRGPAASSGQIQCKRARCGASAFAPVGERWSAALLSGSSPCLDHGRRSLPAPEFRDVVVATPYKRPFFFRNRNQAIHKQLPQIQRERHGSHGEFAADTTALLHRRWIWQQTAVEGESGLFHRLPC